MTARHEDFPDFIFIHLPLNNINYLQICKLREKKWRGNLTETITAYERLGLLELRTIAVFVK